MSLHLQQLYNRQSVINASEIAWVIKEFGNAKAITWLPSYYYYKKTSPAKTAYQFFRKKTANPTQLARINNATSTKSTKAGSSNEASLTAMMEQWFDITPAQASLTKDILGATPDAFVFAKAEAINQLTQEDLIGKKGVCEIKWTHDRQDFSHARLLEFHKWQVQQQIMVTGADYGVLAIFHQSQEFKGSYDKTILVIMPDEAMQEIILEAAQKALNWLNLVKSGKIREPLPCPDRQHPDTKVSRCMA